MSMLPSSITNMFSNDERQRFTSTQENVSKDEVIDQISNEYYNGDREKGRFAHQEAINVLERKQKKDKDNTKDKKKKKEKEDL